MPIKASTAGLMNSEQAEKDIGASCIILQIGMLPRRKLKKDSHGKTRELLSLA